MYNYPEDTSVHSQRVVHALLNWEREGNMRPGRKKNIFVRVCEKLFWLTIYCANHRPKSDSQSGSLFCRVLGRRYPHIICEYDLATAILIKPLNQTCTCKMDSSIFAAMSWLELESTTRASFPSMPSTDRTNGEKYFCCLWEFLPSLSFFFFPPSKESLIGSFFWVSQSGWINEYICSFCSFLYVYILHSLSWK